MRLEKYLPLSLFAAAVLLPILSAAGPQSVLSRVRSIPMEGVAGRIDHMSIDVEGHRLFVAALANNSVEVLDLEGGKAIHAIRGLTEPQGVLYDRETNKLFVTNGGDGALKIFDGSMFRLVGSVKFSSDADNIRYDRAARLVYVGYGDGALGIVEAASGRHVGDVRLAAHPESFQLERAGSRVFVNVPGANAVVVVDRSRRSVVATWPLPGAKDNYPMALDESGGRLFVGCRTPAKVLVYNTASGTVSVSFPVSGDADDLFFDPDSHRLYVSSGAGYLEVFQEDNQHNFALIERAAIGKGSRTSLFVPEQGRLYVAVPRHGNRAAHILVYKADGRE